MSGGLALQYLSAIEPVVESRLGVRLPSAFQADTKHRIAQFRYELPTTPREKLHVDLFGRHAGTGDPDAHNEVRRTDAMHEPPTLALTCPSPQSVNRSYRN